MARYTLGLFANMYPASEEDTFGIFIRRMVDDLEKNDVRVIKAVKTSRSPLAYSTFYLQSLRNVLRGDIDILQAEYIPHSSIIPALLKRDTPLVLKFHGTDGFIYPFKNRVYMAMIQYMLRRADYVITCSEALKNNLISIGADPERISAIANGIDTQGFHPLNRKDCRFSFKLPADSSVFLFVGRLHPFKGIHEILETAKINPEITFVLAGPGKIPPHPPNCIFTGPVDPSRVPLLMNAADCLILPSYSEGLGLVLAESLACGVPVIASNVGGSPEVVRHMETGLLIPSHDITALSDAVRWITGHPLEKEEMGRVGRLDMIQRYDRRALIKELMGIHLELINKSRLNRE